MYFRIWEELQHVLLVSSVLLQCIYLIFIVDKQFFPGDSKLRLGWLHGVAEMGIQQAKQDPSPTKIEPLVALLDRLGCVKVLFLIILVGLRCASFHAQNQQGRIP